MAAAVTPRLFVQTDTPLEIAHTLCDSPDKAVSLIESGTTVLVPDYDCAYSVLFLLGLPKEDIERRLSIALRGLNYSGEADPAAPVPLAPGAARP
jgi:hypothetical protein